MNILESLKWRYATKVFDTTKKVSEEDINNILQEANLTATSYGLQPFSIIVVSNQNVKDKLVKYSFNQKHISSSSHLFVLAVRTDIDEKYLSEYTERIENIRKLKSGSTDIFKNKMLSVFTDMSQEDKVIWAQKQVYIMLGTLLISLAERGIDSCPMEGFNPDAYDDFLRLNEKNLHSTVVLPIGYRSKSDITQGEIKVRKNIDDIIIRM